MRWIGVIARSMSLAISVARHRMSALDGRPVGTLRLQTDERSEPTLFCFSRYLHHSKPPVSNFPHRDLLKVDVSTYPVGATYPRHSDLSGD